MDSVLRKKIFIDSSLFLGMNSVIENVRQVSAGFIAAHFGQTIYMSLEQVGYCDDIIWRFPRALQDQYYPFMDRLHTEMEIKRIPYTFNDINGVLAHKELRSLALPRALIAAQVLNHDGMLYTHDNELLSLEVLVSNIGRFDADGEVEFDPPLNNYYEMSQVVKIDLERLSYA
jgi:hypothetical protein